MVKEKRQIVNAEELAKQISASRADDLSRPSSYRRPSVYLHSVRLIEMFNSKFAAAVN